jgi:hypothetical protein
LTEGSDNISINASSVGRLRGVLFIIFRNRKLYPPKCAIAAVQHAEPAFFLIGAWLGFTATVFAWNWISENGWPSPFLVVFGTALGAGTLGGLCAVALRRRFAKR